jgi:hypothetical protein
MKACFRLGIAAEVDGSCALFKPLERGKEKRAGFA